MCAKFPIRCEHPKNDHALFIGSATFNVAVASKPLELQIFKMLRRAKFRGSKKSVKFLLTFYEKMSAASSLILLIVFAWAAQ